MKKKFKKIESNTLKIIMAQLPIMAAAVNFALAKERCRIIGYDLILRKIKKKEK